MSRLVASASMSLDGYVAYDDDTVGPLFDWYQAGSAPTDRTELTASMTAASAAHWREYLAGVRCLLVGRRLFDFTDGWQGRHPLEVPVVVLTHHPPTDWSYPGSEDFWFVTDLDEALTRCREIAGDGDVGVAAGEVASQCLAAGVLDRVVIDLVPVVLGSGRPYFTNPDAATRLLGDPIAVVPSTRVTHLVYDVTAPG